MSIAISRSPKETLQGGLEPWLSGQRKDYRLSGFEPSLGGTQRFEMRIWSKLVDARWPHKETLVASFTPEHCDLYATVLLQMLPEGASFSHALHGGAALTGQYTTSQRAAAAYVLGLIGARGGHALASELVMPLVGRLGADEDESVRVEAARALALLGDPAAERALIDTMAAAGWKLRQAVIQALGRVGERVSLNYLTELYEASETLNESRAALEAIGEIGGRLGGDIKARAYDMIMRVFVRAEGLQRGAAARALGKLRDLRSLDLLIQVAMNGRGDLRCAAVEALGILGDSQAVPPLIFVLTSGDYTARHDAVRALIRIGSASVIPALAVLRHKDVEVRKCIIDVLGKIGAKDAVEPLIELVSDVDVEVRQASVNALGLIGEPTAIDALIRALSDTDSAVRKEAAMMLGGFHNSVAVGPLCLALWDADMTVRWFAAYALGLHGDPRAVQPLIQALDDRAPNVSQTASDALVKLADVAVPELVRCAVSVDRMKDRRIADILTQISSELALDALEQITNMPTQAKVE